MLNAPCIIGIAGGSCSGKSFLAKQLADELPGSVTIVESDSYYADLSHLEPQERAISNFDVPNALDHRLLLEHINKLATGISIEKPVYDFSTHTRTLMTQKVQPTNFIIVEGLLVLHWKELRELFSTTVFVETQDELCLERRIVRDMKERGRTRQSVIEQYNKTVRPMYKKSVLPSKEHAKIIIDGNSNVDSGVKNVLETLRH